MSKVGILSMQRIKNYGSFLQAYALKKILEDLGHEVEFVDYHVGNLIETKKIKIIDEKKLKIFKFLIGNVSLKHKIQYILYKLTFEKKYFKLLGLNKKKNYNPKLDTLIIGSDEVFNCFQKNKNVGYSLELFGKNNRAKRLISYAASFGNTTLEKIEYYGKSKELGNLLNKFDYISVRDKNSNKIIKKLCNKKIKLNYNLDPVLVYDYIKNINNDFKIKEKYIILYSYLNRLSSEEEFYIKKFTKKNNLKIYSIGGVQKCTDKYIDCSPFEVFNYFKNAEYVVTDTFHGTIFSVVTHKKFITLIRKSNGEFYGNEEKITDLLERLHLSNRIIKNIEELEKKLLERIDFSDCDDIINKEKEKTLNYLKNEV